MTFLLFQALLAASGPALPDMAAADVYNGIDPKNADKFWERWELVTVRFRQDNGEQRFVYANKAAAAAMRSGKKAFPNGAAFAKVAFATAPDATFPNSLQPTTLARVQLMQKDSAKHAETGGWAYAIYPERTREGKSENTIVRACHACHMVVPQRDYVFSTPAFFGTDTALNDSFAARFQQTKVGSLTKMARSGLAQVDDASTQVQALRMDLFAGSIQESIGPLTTFAADSTQTFLLYDNNAFLVARKQASDTRCRTKVLLAYRHSITPAGNMPKHVTAVLRKAVACDGVTTTEPAMYLTD